jgi:hypothetical protein
MTHDARTRTVNGTVRFLPTSKEKVHMAVTTQMVKELRERTGAGILDAK